MGAGAPAVTVREAVLNVVSVRSGAKQGSGFVLRDGGLILTNAHVISSGTRPVIKTSSGDTFLGTVVQVLEAADLALIRVVGLGPART